MVDETEFDSMDADNDSRMEDCLRDAFFGMRYPKDEEEDRRELDD